MKKCHKITLTLIAILLIALWLLVRYLECNPIFMGGGRPHIPQRCYASDYKKREKYMDKLKRELLDNVAFECKHENRHPPLSEETQQIYNYAYYRDLHNMWTGEDGDAVWQDAARYYRIAAANDDYKANIRLQYLLETGRATSPRPYGEVHNLNKQLGKTLPALAYYKLYGHLDIGFGVTTGKDGKYGYLRRAADLGNREAQYELGGLLREVAYSDREIETEVLGIVKQLFQCASEQGLGEASFYLGIILKDGKEYDKAVLAFHQGAKNGDHLSALGLSYAYSGRYTEDDTLEFLDREPDLQRAKRYETIGLYLSDYDYLNPKVPDLDEIVPLPPAELPEWDGKIAFQRWYEGEPPPKPSDELVKKLAEQAGLDWQTGLPLKK